MPIAIESQGLSKNFKRFEKAPGIIGSLSSFFNRKHVTVPAVTDFSARIERGEMVGLLGPNGAGKTTLMKIFSGIIAPSSGKLQVLGEDPFQRSKLFRKSIALVMGQKSQLWWDIPAMDSFMLLCSYYEIPKSSFERRLSELSESLGVSRLLKTHVRRLSLGERMKMELIACLLHEPKIVFLDEPTIGLDVVAQRRIREFISEYQRRKNITVILTSHYMADVEALCDRIILVLDGSKRFDGSKQDFSKILGHEKFVAITFERPLSENYLSDHPALSGLHPAFNSAGDEVELRISEAQVRERMIEILRCLPVKDFSTKSLPIERVMSELLANPSLIPPGH